MKTKWLIIGLAVILYVAFRLWNLTAPCLWFDEIFSVHAAQHSWNELFSFVAQDLIHPPLFYILLKVWMAIGGDSLLWLRLFPVAAASVALIPLALLCRELKFSAIETGLVILLLAVNGSLIKYAQEVRMYAPLFCLSVFSIWLFVRWARRENASLIALFFVNLLLIYTHYFGWLIVFTEIIIVLGLRKDWRKWLIMFVLWALSFLPWAYAVFTAYKQNAGLEQNLNWADRPGPLQLMQFFAALHQPFYFQQTGVDIAFSIFGLPVILISAAAIVYLFVDEKENKFELKILLAFAVVPLIVAFFVSLVSPFSIWGTRHLLVIFAPYFLLAAMGLKSIKVQSFQYTCYGVLALTLLVASAFYVARPQPLYSWCGWNRLAEEIGTSEVTEVYAFEDAVAYEFWFASQTRANNKVQVILIDDDPSVKEDKAYFLPRGFDEVKKASKDSISGDKFWIAVRNIWDDKKHPLWIRLEEQGYKLGPALRLKTKDGFDFMVPVERENQ